MQKETSLGVNHILREYKAPAREKEFDEKLEAQARRSIQFEFKDAETRFKPRVFEDGRIKKEVIKHIAEERKKTIETAL